MQMLEIKVVLDEATKSLDTEQLKHALKRAADAGLTDPSVKQVRRGTS